MDSNDNNINKVKFNSNDNTDNNNNNNKDNFNLSFSENVATKIGRYFLNLIDKHFPGDLKFHNNI